MYRIPWIRIIICGALFAIAAVAIEKIVNGPGNPNVVVPQPVTVTPVPGGVGVPAGTVAPSATPSATLAVAADAAARAELQEATKRLKEAATDVNLALDQLNTWETDVEPLRDNTNGRFVAAHADLARQMAYLYQQPRPAKSDLITTRERIESLQTETDRLSAAATAQRLSPDRAIEIQELHRRSREARTQWTEAVERAQAIVREARRKQPANAAATPSTPDAAPPASTVAATAATPLTPTSPNSPGAEPSATATDSAPPATVTTIPTSPGPLAQEAPKPPGKSLQETVVEIGDQSKIEALKDKMAREERERIEKEKLAAAERELAKRVAAEKARLVAESHSDEVQRALQPFLVKRNLQPRLAGASLQWRQTTEQQPMSLLALENVGALADSMQGLSALARVGSHRELSGPRWDFNPSPRTWSSDTQDRLKQAQELLRRLGPTLVDERLLSP